MSVTVTFYKFIMNDVEDVDVYVAEPIWRWQQTDHSRWVMSHARNLRYCTCPEPNRYTYRIWICGDLEEDEATEYFLRWS